ncbi:MAG: LysR family transcriptional regulator [Bacteroidetes bacterium]|nr:MAG: LysR family transcriptional regulator [Bacteroidota bacterium]MBL1145778.1 LysR family transcriptional regulator [Bacteroidota bacterium]MCB0803110.1 LysR family transcriptional regulator [Flavobacteriales bacterium]NOG58572.1 LysR family transcriptional regulator [Bacteroidota bacterium]
MANTPFHVRSRVWIADQKGTFLGEGRIQLLKAIEEKGSITKAAHSMNMSYLKAWKLIESMNNSSEMPLVIRTSGGKGGGGTILTTHGEKAIRLYQELNMRCQEFLKKEFEALNKKY